MRGDPRKGSDNTCPYWFIFSLIFSGTFGRYKMNRNKIIIKKLTIL